ncbi:hypothetical protein PCANC_19156 [Puccinia coronata f. sp. avenae]|uniref:Uncharacterized protein n=1 Tax=Puccinia coronata f. sp. avenae TaxID=200324 RepID=A0A2N5SGS4_9BASI|nr:hypothetical protein PCANC_19156 [Puccinia coronata f. sp. avenae]
MSLFLNQHSEGTPHPHRVPSATPRTNRRRLSSPSEEEPNPQRQCSRDSDSDLEEDPFSILQQAKDNHRHSLPENDQDIDPDLAPAGQSTSRPLARFMEMIGVDADEHINTAPMELQTLFRTGRNDDRYFGAVTGAPELVVRPLSGWNAQGVYSELSESSRRVQQLRLSQSEAEPSSGRSYARRPVQGRKVL